MAGKRTMTLTPPNNQGNREDEINGIKVIIPGEPVLAAATNRNIYGLLANENLLYSVMNLLFNGKVSLTWSNEKEYFRGMVAVKGSNYYICMCNPSASVVNKDPSQSANAKLWENLGSDWFTDGLLDTSENSIFLVKSKNLSDVPDKKAARDNLGISDIVNTINSKFLEKEKNLSDLSDIEEARRNLGVSKGELDGAYLKIDQNLKDLANKDTALQTLGLHTSLKGKQSVRGASNTDWATYTAGSIAERDTAGNLFAKVFNGEATQVRLADLAEYYETKDEIENGTVVQFNPDLEGDEVIPHNPATLDKNSFYGVVSTSPGFILNNNETQGRTAIALTGRVPVKFHNPKGVKVTRGMPVCPSSTQSGYCEPYNHKLNSPIIGHIINLLPDGKVEIKVKG
ncbi:hypothetical protein C3I27_04480 [Campylobacter jejuni]|uniref:Uncharacterized protein n=2 Tax=Campylobacter jejuni TaxID=197 RepID=A0AAX1Z526_CAMJU|nr:hypothetical protein C3I27_04480 [Campylobacter jejuni]